MPTLQAILAFAALSLALIIVPGPSVMFIIGRAVALGRRAALLTIAGNSSGTYVQVLLVSMGVGAIVERSIFVFNTLKIVGALYLVLLGIAVIRRPIGQLGDGDDVQGKRASRVMREGFIVGFTNPKSFVFLAAFLPQFADTNGLPITVQMAALGLVFTSVAIACDTTYGLLASSFRQWFRTSLIRERWMNRVAGFAMAGLGIRLLTTGRAN